MTPGQRAYEAWAQAHSGPHEVKITPWEMLSKRAQSVWNEVARAARL